ncbi:MAG: hypothetical protein GWN00_04060, partial [Aliifodinibius sp.]|nr:hypothetical protein [Fodinibius sp.]NIY24009.1 hypothetical protein [Fodinibius sp.]
LVQMFAGLTVRKGDVTVSEGDLTLGVGGITLAGSLTVSGDLIIDATDKIRLDGSSSGDTYISEYSANAVGIWAGGVRSLTVTSTNIAGSGSSKAGMITNA